MSSARPGSELTTELPRRLRKEMTRQEARLWVALRQLRPAGYHFRRQVPIGRFILDFACLKAKLVLEVDGGQHGEDRHAERDRARDADLATRGSRVLRFWNGEVDRNFAGVIETVLAALQPAETAAASPLPADPTPLALRASRPSPPGRERARVAFP